MKLNDLIKAAIFSAIAIGLGYMFLFVPNVEFISVTVFLSGLTLGFFWGAIVGMSSIALYSIFNPLGSGIIYFTLLIGQVVAMGMIGLVGAFSKRFFNIVKPKHHVFLAGTIGFMCTSLYDAVTNLAYPISAGYAWTETLVYAFAGMLFTAMHLFSNVIIFSIVVSSYIKKMRF